MELNARTWKASILFNSELMSYTLSDISITRIYDESNFHESYMGKPPTGRSNKSHNLIMGMNKKGSKKR